MTTGYVHPRLHHEIVEKITASRDEWRERYGTDVAKLRSDLADARTQAAFWRRAAEQAVTGWDALEDKLDQAIQILQPYKTMLGVAAEAISKALEILVELSPLEPDTAELEAVLRELPEIDLGDGQKLRVVEEETPIKKP